MSCELIRGFQAPLFHLSASHSIITWASLLLTLCLGLNCFYSQKLHWDLGSLQVSGVGPAFSVYILFHGTFKLNIFHHRVYFFFFLYQITILTSNWWNGVHKIFKIAFGLYVISPSILGLEATRGKPGQILENCLSTQKQKKIYRRVYFALVLVLIV